MSLLIGKKAPDFCVPAVLGNGELVEKFILSEAIVNQYALLFFYPLDFTFVCPSELIALNHRMDAFRERQIVVIGISVDSQFTHYAWRNTPIEQGGIGPVKYTLASDISHQVCKNYGVELATDSVALRGAFLIDKKGIVRAELVHDLPFGRNIDEILRVFDAIDFFEQYGEVCPANWHKGDKGMQASPQGVVDYLSTQSENL
jgi:peroxiredoxin 2/4